MQIWSLTHHRPLCTWWDVAATHELWCCSPSLCLPYTQTLRVQGLHKLFLCWWAQIIWYSVACFVLSVGWNHQEFCSWISSISCFVAKTKIQQKQVLSERKDDGYKNFEFFLVRRVVTREINSGAKMGWINDVYWLAQGQYWKPDMPVETYPAY